MLNRRAKKFIFIVSLLLTANNLFCHNEDKHNEDTLKLLFGKNWQKYNTYEGDVNKTPEQRKIQALMAAMYLTIDQMQGQTKKIKEKLTILQKFGISNLPFPEQFITPGGRHHQRYTHRGWDFNYPSTDDTKKWQIRKERIFLPTLEKVFSFSDNNRKKKEHLGALLYYVHILGDHSAETKTTNPDRIAISGRKDEWAIISKLSGHLSELFYDRKNEKAYNDLNKYFTDSSNTNKVFKEGRKLSDDELEELKAFARKTLDILFENVPLLLQKEDFFVRAFPK